MNGKPHHSVKPAPLFSPTSLLSTSTAVYCDPISHPAVDSIFLFFPPAWQPPSATLHSFSSLLSVSVPHIATKTTVSVS